jgi:2',3'-cyclic-nucleotide 2'-phosphodiesterase (5'-nucleotidase family)
MLSSEIHGDKTAMRHTVVATRLRRALGLLLVLLVVGSSAFAQSAAIEPCQATPAPKASTPNAVAMPASVNTRVGETLVDAGIPGDSALEKMLAPYSERVRALDVVIGNLDGGLQSGKIGGGSLGNFVADAMLAEAKNKLDQNVVLALTNEGGLRKKEISSGQLRVSDLFELLPFENTLIAVDVTGTQLLKLLHITRDAQAGARVKFRWNEQSQPELISAKLIDESGREREIDDKASYTIVTIDYLYKLGSGNYAILQESKNLKTLNLTIRDAVMNYVKSQTAAGRSIKTQLDDRFVQVGAGPANSEDPPND